MRRERNGEKGQRSRSVNSYTDEVVVAELERMRGTPSGVFEDPELLRLAIDTLASDLALSNDYWATQEPATLAGPIHVYGGRSDTITHEDLTAWQRETSAQSSVTMFDGGHFFLHEQRVATRLNIIARCGADARGVSGWRQSAEVVRFLVNRLANNVSLKPATAMTM